MTAAEQGYLLLTSPLGDPGRHTMSPYQMRRLKQRLKEHPVQEPQRQMEPRDLLRLGYSPEDAQWILSLLEDTPLMERYLRSAEEARCGVLTWLTAGYPRRVLETLKADSPGSIWTKGDLSILEEKRIALVGSRALAGENAIFAREVGRQAALQGYVLVSGNARGADKTAQEACLSAGGRVISVVADSLREHRMREGVLYLSEDGFDLPFSAPRALSRNRLIHSMCDKTLVAQCNAHKGGTWGGAWRNLKGGWSRLVCFADGSQAVRELCENGAAAVTMEQLSELASI